MVNLLAWLILVSETNCIKEVVSSSFPYFRMRKEEFKKQQGNWLSYTIASDTKVNDATWVQLKQLVCFYSFTVSS